MPARTVALVVFPEDQ